MATPSTIYDLELPTIALVGRVNVGKSTLFNKITETNHALISNIPGTTRTRNIGIALWRGKNFRVIDTGGLTFDSAVPLEDEIIQQTEIALEEADVVLFVVDIQGDVLPQEYELAKKLQKFSKNKKKLIIFVANKGDRAIDRSRAHDHEFLRLGLGVPITVSAINGAGLGDLMDFVSTKLNKLKIRPKKTKRIKMIKVAIVGKPNVGKSSLFNKLIGQDSAIVSSMPHTTREPYDTLVKYTPNTEIENSKKPETTNILFIDTAGIRRKTKVSGLLERAGIGKSMEAIRASDIVLLVLDAAEPITDQDQQLAGLLRERAKSVIIIVNKWDLAEDNEDTFRNDVKQLILQKFPHLDFAPVIFVSAKNGYRVHQIFPDIVKAYEARQIQLTATELHDFIKKAIRKHLPTRGMGVRHPAVLGLRQLSTNPPVFDILVKPRTSIHISYAHFLSNQLSEQFNFYACPIIMKISKMKK